MKKIPLVGLKVQYHSIKREVDRKLKSIFENSNFIGGNEVDNFSENLSNLLNVKYSIPVANGTDALYIAMKMLGIGVGDEVITTAHSWISTSETVSQTGAKPIFVDTDEFFCIDHEKIEDKISSKTNNYPCAFIWGSM